MTHNVHACVAKAIIFHVAVVEDGGESDEERYEQLREVVQYPNENIPVATKASQFSPGSFVGLDVSMPSTKTLQ